MNNSKKRKITEVDEDVADFLEDPEMQPPPLKKIRVENADSVGDEHEDIQAPSPPTENKTYVDSI